MPDEKTTILVSGKPEIVAACKELLDKMPQWVSYYSSDSDSLLQDAMQCTPDIVFIDLLMPQITADEMIRKIKSLSALRNTVVLTYYVPSPTAQDHFAIRAQMMAVQYMKIATEQAGAKEYLGAFNPNSFLDLINSYLKDA